MKCAGQRPMMTAEFPIQIIADETGPTIKADGKTKPYQESENFTLYMTSSEISSKVFHLPKFIRESARNPYLSFQKLLNLTSSRVFYNLMD